MLVQHFVRGLSDHISGGVQILDPKTMEVAVEKAHLVEENLNLSLGGAPGMKKISASASGQL